MKVAVGSMNPTKVEGVRLAFKQYFDDVEIVPKNVESGVPSQPFNDDVIRGAINRAINAFGNCDYSVGVEAGLFTVNNTITGYMDFQVAVIYDGEKFTIGFGPGFEFPPLVVKKALEGVEVGEIMEKITGIEKIGEKFGAIYYLSKGKISRIELTRLAVTMALIPRLNQELYKI
ncbi:MAG TPA: inosine/xanthosine triphosphatase [Archaeoglobus profundus]|nr:inosine/xanthosine triphosphatase [Archaeoglobus profundus]